MLALAIALAGIAAATETRDRSTGERAGTAPFGADCECAVQSPSASSALRASSADDWRATQLDAHAELAGASRRPAAVLSRLGARGVATPHRAVAPRRGYDATAPPA